jgi:hypothetical protein
LQKAGRIASKHGYNIAFSNPAFELWYLLHFIDQRSYIADTDSVISILDSKHCIEKYSKSGDYYELLLPRLQQAIDRAYTLQEYHTKNGLPMLHRDSNPCTTVAQLAELLHSRANQRQF